MEHETSSLTVAHAVSDESDRVSIQKNPAHENAGADCPAAPTAPSRSSASLYSRKKKEIAPAGTGFGAADPYSTIRNEACVPDTDDMVRLDDEFVFTNKQEGCHQHAADKKKKKKVRVPIHPVVTVHMSTRVRRCNRP